MQRYIPVDAVDAIIIFGTCITYQSCQLVTRYSSQVATISHKTTLPKVPNVRTGVGRDCGSIRGRAPAPLLGDGVQCKKALCHLQQQSEKGTTFSKSQSTSITQWFRKYKTKLATKQGLHPE